jgi:hypothetical protein
MYTVLKVHALKLTTFLFKFFHPIYQDVQLDIKEKYAYEQIEMVYDTQNCLYNNHKWQNYT